MLVRERRRVAVRAPEVRQASGPCGAARAAGAMRGEGLLPEKPSAGLSSPREGRKETGHRRRLRPGSRCACPGGGFGLEAPGREVGW